MITDYRILNKWRNAVLTRDNYTCKKCGATESLICHHIIDRYEYPELTLDVDNGITLCRSCHMKTHDELKPNICSYPRKYEIKDGMRTWEPIIPLESL